MTMKFAYKTAEEYAEVLTAASESYYNSGETLMTDQEYDQLFDEFQERFPDHEFFKTIGAQSSNLFKKVTHEIAMGSQAKVNTLEELQDWWKKTEEKVGSLKVLVSEKLDGFSLSLSYDKKKFYQGITRGTGVIGDDVTQNVKKIKDIPKSVKLEGKLHVRGEALISRETYTKEFSDKANARNAAAGTIRRLDGERCEYLSFRAYDIVGTEFKTEEEKFKTLQTLGFKTPEYKLCSSVEEVQEVWESYEEKRQKLSFEMDGLVVMVNDLKQQEILGIINQRPRYSRAYKFSAEAGITTLEDCEWQVGRTGRITPVGKVTPVKVAGVTISSVTLHNLSEMDKLGLKLNQKVEIKRAGDVIPKITKVLTAKGDVIKIPRECPVCNEPTTRGEIFLTCDNAQCSAKQFFSLLHWVKSLEIKGFGEELVDRLSEAGLIQEPADFYTLTKEQLSELDRMGEKSAEKVLKELHAKKSLTLPLFVKALGIPQASEKTVELILPTHDSLDKITQASEEELANIHGIGEITAKVILTGLKDRKKQIQNLLNHITLVAPKKIEGGKLQGQSYCFTGVRDKNLEVALVEAGAKIASGVSKTLTVLVAKDPEENSSKLQKARDLGVEILNLEQTWARVK